MISSIAVVAVGGDNCSSDDCGWGQVDITIRSSSSSSSGGGSIW